MFQGMSSRTGNAAGGMWHGRHFGANSSSWIAHTPTLPPEDEIECYVEVVRVSYGILRFANCSDPFIKLTITNNADF